MIRPERRRESTIASATAFSMRTRYFLPLDDGLVSSAKSVSGATAQERINARHYFLQDAVARELPKPGTRIPE